MRLVHLLVPSEELDAVTGVLDEEGVDYVVTEERSRGDAEVVEFPLPIGAVETVLKALRDAGVEDGAYTVITRGESADTGGTPTSRSATSRRSRAATASLTRR